MALVGGEWSPSLSGLYVSVKYFPDTHDRLGGPLSLILTRWSKVFPNPRTLSLDPGYNPRTVHMRFVVGSVSLRQGLGCARLLRFQEYTVWRFDPSTIDAL